MIKKTNCNFCLRDNWYHSIFKGLLLRGNCWNLAHFHYSCRYFLDLS